jgi:hypothetical protein
MVNNCILFEFSGQCIKADLFFVAVFQESGLAA